MLASCGRSNEAGYKSQSKPSDATSSKPLTTAAESCIVRLPSGVCQHDPSRLVSAMQLDRSRSRSRRRVFSFSRMRPAIMRHPPETYRPSCRFSVACPCVRPPTPTGGTKLLPSWPRVGATAARALRASLVPEAKGRRGRGGPSFSTAGTKSSSTFGASRRKPKPTACFETRYSSSAYLSVSLFVRWPCCVHRVL